MQGPIWRRPAVLAVASLFFLNGLGYAALASRLPELQRALGLSESQLGLARTGFVIGIVATMLVAPRLVRRYRAQRAAPLAAGLYVISICLAGSASGTTAFGFWLLAAGAFNALVDIGQNVLAVRLEKLRMLADGGARANSLLSPLEGLQAVGVAAGTGFGLLTAGRIPLAHSFAVLAVAGPLVAAITLAALRTAGPAAPGRVPCGVRAARTAWPARLRWLTAMSFSALLLEGALTNWIAVLVVGSGASLLTAGLGLTAFATALCAGRLGYGTVAARVDQVVLVRVMGGLVLAGIAGLVLLSTAAGAVLVSAAVAGLGLANLHPFCTGAVGHGSAPDDEEQQLGRLNRIAYTGIAVEGVLIAGLTALLGLHGAIAVVGLLAAVFVCKASIFSAEHHWAAPAPVR
ncbi:hypothetical protein LZ318_37550 [Saccharopolyspora indica]|uniref:MFS transporter n=1 Tax=Saccharopolyspora indica TaxID=1229659 RepID=UPI0022EB3A1E|nr:MFS transporter [Saccharopolyspora indica]MDA3642938.1 hypothetical protein [Saccharopolyspora indica]